MESSYGFNPNDEPIELPPGFRFHPTDEELITHYLSPKILNDSFCTIAIGEVDLNRVEPWDLPWKAKIGEKEWYFFCVRDRKYPTGLRTNRATNAGYWKATGKDKEIFRDRILVGMKKTLVFYRGRAPRGEKTNWVMHEYRLEGKQSMHTLPKASKVPKTSKNEWVICRIFKKSSGGKKVHISGLLGIRNSESNSQSSDLPPLLDLSSDENQTRTTVEGSHVTCFSILTKHPRQNLVDELSSASRNCDFSSLPFTFPKVSTLNSIYSSQIVQSLSYTDPVLAHDQSIQQLLVENNVKQNVRPEFLEDMPYNEVRFKSFDDQEFPIFSTAPVDLDCLWNY
ncbi:hypothetical protein CDL12_16569 [Handroanthus impetiginosus]|uniref:NAC domain-containing protein n=1 Tax=Handroanthus impetiginosus TaxID=429701 RepID=A0A2G9H007_9LAMI|nr:hypothetical protein CDL12_16569 [Handroanthus impetiginosus]